MYIIDKNKDYYDYHSHIYGVDKQIVYDRRNSVVLDNSNLASLAHQGNPVRKSDNIRFLLLEVGEVQYLFKLYDYIIEDQLYYNVLDFSMELVRTFTDYTHRFTTPISIRGVNLDYFWNWKYYKQPENAKKWLTEGSYVEVVKRMCSEPVENPILTNTKITGLVDGEVIWKELQNYISSLNNDVDCSTPMTDVEKAEIHGFDKKTSFRNPIK